MAGTTTVRIHPRSQRLLERLQETWQRRFGSRPSKQDLLEQALEYVDAHEVQFMEQVGWKPMTKAQIKRLHRKLDALDWGPNAPTDLSERVDDIVYGEGS